jgi:hypothetical protein
MEESIISYDQINLMVNTEEEEECKDRVEEDFVSQA